MGENKILLNFFLILLFLFIICSSFSNASNFYPSYYISNQKINYVNEVIEVGESEIYVKFKGTILVDESIFNESDWVEFTFNPKVNRFDKLTDYTYSISLQTHEWGGGEVFESNKEAIYTSTGNEYGNYVYNVSLKSLSGWNSIIFHANYTLTNRITNVHDYEYAFYYRSDINTDDKTRIQYHFPNILEINQVTVDGFWKGRTLKIFTPSKEEVDKGVYFYFTNLEEKNKAERKEKLISRGIDILLIVIGALISLLAIIVYENFKKEKKIFGDINLRNFKKYKRAIIKVYKKK